jgi:hypothetical protein
VSYKEDEKDLVIDEAFLTVDDDTLDREKDLFTIPLAASDGDYIDQYDLTPLYDDSVDPPALIGYEAEFNECVHRLMRVVQWYPYKLTVLAFQGLSAEQIIAERYASYQAYVNQPRIITERFRVPIADLRTLDYSRPVFLAKYGRHFAIIDIKWTVTQDTCEAKLLMLAEAAIGVSPVPPAPTPTLTGISASFSQGGAVVVGTDNLDTLKQYLTVTATYSDSTTRVLSAGEYKLSGTLAYPSATVTAEYQGESDTFSVAVAYDAQVEYLESTGTQYIDTGILPAANEVWKVTFQGLTSNSQGVMGVYSTSGRAYIARYQGNFGAALGSGSFIGVASAETTAWHEFSLDLTSGEATIDQGAPVSIGTFNGSSREIYVFARNNGSANWLATVKIKELSIGTRMILVPVRCGQVGYMYDRVSGKLFGNAGTVDFIFGNDI